jgi:hypothetical protein
MTGRLTAVGAAFGSAVVLLSSASGNAGVKLFNGNLCATASKGALAKLKVAGPCVSSKPDTKVQSTPLGSIRTVTYQARWGSFGTISAPTHHASAEVIYVQGSAAAVAYLQKAFRGEVLANGAPVSMNPLTTEAGDTAACKNPPIDDCTKGEVMAMVGQYGLIVEYYGPAKFIGPDDPQNPSVDEKNDVAQEDAIKASVVALANSITAAL